MHRMFLLIAVPVLMVPILAAQSRSPQSRPFKRTPTPGSKPILNMSHPTRVRGDGTPTPSGVKYWDIEMGQGSSAEKGHVVKVLYEAWVENGKEFDGSTSAEKPTIFTLGAGQVVPGWEEGMEGMKVGGKRQIHVPADLAYGAAGVPPLVPPNSNVIFDVMLIEVQ
jgi:FKBP-type peptidyl-prolyl cis-trans isomerase